MQLSSLADDSQWRVPAACLGEMPRRGLAVRAGMRVLDLERTFLHNPGLSSVVVVNSDGAPTCITRAGFFTALTGPLGFGRSLHTHHVLSQMSLPPSLLLPASTTIAESARAVLERPADAHYDDFVIAFDDGGFGTLCVAELFAELAHTQAFEALHDGLTGLANRRLFLHRLSEGERGALAVLFVDVDDFKTINDGLGHDIGDEALTVVAGRLTAVAGAAATVARLGGDEFAIVVPLVDGRQEAEEFAATVVSALSVPLRTGDARAVLSASVGVALGDDGESPEDLLRNADLAMYAAKRRGKGSYAFYEKGMHESARLRVELRSELEGALGRDELYLDYQPIVTLGEPEVVAAEALLRWRRRDGTLVAPADFIWLCEQSGLIIPIGSWVLAQACRQAMIWADARPGLPPMRVSVNISPRQLQWPGFVEDVAKALADSGLPAEYLTLEITEGMVSRDFDGVLSRLAECRELGVTIALDDFGAGFSSLGRLSRMPIDVLKLDRSFVTQLGNPSDRGLVAGIVALADSLGLVTVGEGVETEEQAQALRELGCQLAQGFFYARPMAPEGIAVGALVAA